MRRDQISLQLYTVRDHTAQDMEGTLRQLAEIGYTAVEFAGFGGLSAIELRRILDELGMRASGAHIPLDTWEAAAEAVLGDIRALGASHATVPIILPDRRPNAEAISRLARSFNRWGELCQSEGVKFSYHNHDFEFAPFDETTLWDILVNETDPELVRFELDLYWVRYGGGDPEALLRNLGDRILLVHLKDMAPDESRSDLPVGEGGMPWLKLIEIADEAGVDWYIVEQDNPKDAMEDVRISLRNLQQMADD